MMQVVTRQQPSIHAAYQGAREEIPVTLRAVYDKLNGLEPEISAALVGDSAEQAGRVITSLAAIRTPLLRDYRVKILDGNALGGREHRLAESRGQSAAPLPDKALVVFEPALEVITWMIPP
ncbi:transposase, partial [Thiocystis violacea]|nr:transposase [Thiocystis violacea]